MASFVLFLIHKNTAGILIHVRLYFKLVVVPYEIQSGEDRMYIAKGSNAVLPCIVVGDGFDSGADTVAWSKYLHEVL